MQSGNYYKEVKSCLRSEILEYLVHRYGGDKPIYFGLHLADFMST